jgi:transcription elongation GreA/GreB family factor
MSRAFVKEPEGDQPGDAPLERPQSGHPNYITPRGLEELNDRFEALRRRARELEGAVDELPAKSELASVQAELRFLEKRIQAAIPVDASMQDGDEIRFGATVDVQDEEGGRHLFTIVGEDEADPERGLISWVSPLGRALLSRRVGDAVRWQRPVGDLELEILSFNYETADSRWQTGEG